MSHLMNTYARLPIGFVRGEGVWLWDGRGKRYLDAVSGIAVNTLGHAHPRLAKALTEQVRTLIHTSNLYQVPKQEELAARLVGLANMDNAFFCNSGAEANEAAIKLARLYGHQKGIDNPTIIVMEKSFHGRTMATLSATGSRRVQAGFEPLLGGFARVPYNDVNAVAQVAGHNKNIVAILVEPIQGEAGIRVPLPLPDYLRGLRRICDEHEWLLMLDEVQCGIGRTGKWFAHQYSGVKPDVMTLAKGLGSGVPIGACVGAGAAGDVFKPGSHGSTFGGNPLACVAALTTLAVIEEENLMPHALKLGAFIRDGLAQALAGVNNVVQIRGEGLMIGIELAQPCGEIAELALERGLLINVAGENVIRLLPPLVMQQAEAQQLIDGLGGLILDFSRQTASANARA
ncbi:MAG TPA: aspartate aminotransferase family protein [Burkholderiales bacterium]|nr:aspartate aminotransferase family protein [Burkholderiales bacterium]